MIFLLIINFFRPSYIVLLGVPSAFVYIECFVLAFLWNSTHLLSHGFLVSKHIFKLHKWWLNLLTLYCNDKVFVLRSQTMKIFLFILVSPIGAICSNSKISHHIDFTLWKYCAMLISFWDIDNNSLFRSCNRVSFLFEKSVSFGVPATRIYSNASYSMVVSRENNAFLL